MTSKLSTPLDERMTEVDLAHNLLQKKSEPVYYRTLIEEVFSIKPHLGDPIQAISSLHTQINLDTRFIYLGQGQWGLKSWVPTKSQKKTSSITLANHTTGGDEQERELAGTKTKEFNYFQEDEDLESKDSWDE